MMRVWLVTGVVLAAAGSADAQCSAVQCTEVCEAADATSGVDCTADYVPGVCLRARACVSLCVSAHACVSVSVSKRARVCVPRTVSYKAGTSWWWGHVGTWEAPSTTCPEGCVLTNWVDKKGDEVTGRYVTNMHTRTRTHTRTHTHTRTVVRSPEECACDTLGSLLVTSFVQN